MAASGRRIRCYVEVNIGAEAQKAGVLPDDTPAFVDECQTRWGLTIDGLMCIPPLEEDPAPHFARLAGMAMRCGLPMLSMGMSADWPVAVAAGATHIRVGTAIFGRRPSIL
jgi:hypothetical protein